MEGKTNFSRRLHTAQAVGNRDCWVFGNHWRRVYCETVVDGLTWLTLTPDFTTELRTAWDVINRHCVIDAHFYLDHTRYSVTHNTRCYVDDWYQGLSRIFGTIR